MVKSLLTFPCALQKHLASTEYRFKSRPLQGLTDRAVSDSVKCKACRLSVRVWESEKRRTLIIFSIINNILKHGSVQATQTNVIVCRIDKRQIDVLQSDLNVCMLMKETWTGDARDAGFHEESQRSHCSV